MMENPIAALPVGRPCTIVVLGLGASRSGRRMGLRADERGAKELSGNNWTNFSKRYMMSLWMKKA